MRPPLSAASESEFDQLVRRHEREIHVHCYRMLGSFEEAEDLVQETFLRAWRSRGSFDGGPGIRAWLYQIATNACLDTLRRSSRQVHPLQPYPDRLLNEMASNDAGPEEAAVARETIELAFLAAIQLLTPQQRAVVILRDVLGWPTDRTAKALELTVPAANSALQRARARLREQLPQRRLDWSAGEPSAAERTLLLQFIHAHEQGDIASSLALVREDVRITMPPRPECYQGREAMASLLARAFGPDAPGPWRLIPTAANRQPAAASYLLAHGDTIYRAFKLDVLRVERDRIAEVTTFDATLFPAFGLPPTLS